MSSIKAPQFLLRWRLEYRDRGPKCSMWGLSDQNPEHQAGKSQNSGGVGYSPGNRQKQ